MTNQTTQPPMMLHREMTMEVRAGATEDDPIEIAVSSELPVLRYDWWTGERYYEVLDHGPGGVDLAYARDGLPFLLDHLLRVQVGLVEGVSLDKDRKLRGKVRMGNHPDASWVEKDLRAGIRKKISGGYDPGSNYEVISTKDDKIPTRRYKGWRIYEASTVAVPADYDVGVARSAFEARAAVPASIPQGRKAEDTMSEQSTAPAGGAPAVQRDYDAERRQRNATVGNILAMAHESKRTELTTLALREDWSPDQVAEKVREANIAAATAGVPAGRVELTPKEERQYSVRNALLASADMQTGNRSAASLASFEREVSDEIAKRHGAQPKGLWFPLHLLADRSAAAQVRAAVTGNVATTTSLGGAGVETQMQSLIEILRAEAVLSKLGVRFLTGLNGNIAFPRQITANTWTWEGENPSTEKALTAATLEQMSMSPKTGYGATAYSRQLLTQSSFSVEQFVREDLAMIAALGIDVAGINGSGSSNQPTGVLNLSGVETEVMGTNGANLAWANLVSYETKQSTNNAARGNLAFLTTPGVRGKLKTTLKNTISGADYLWGSSNELNGYPAVASNQVPSNLTKGTSTTVCHGVVFGNWNELLLGVWGDALDVVVNPYTYAKQGMIEVVEYAMVDVNARHPKSFVVTKDVTIT